MEKQLKAVIDELKIQVRANLKKINANQDIINEILSIASQHEREEREQEFSELFDENKNLLEVNDDLIKMQIEMVKFNQKYNLSADTKKTKNNSAPEGTKGDVTIEEMFDLTVKEVIPFNDSHPYFNDNTFFNKLLNYYVNKESYETCDELVKMRG